MATSLRTSMATPGCAGAFADIDLAAGLFLEEERGSSSLRSVSTSLLFSISFIFLLDCRRTNGAFPTGDLVEIGTLGIGERAAKGYSLLPYSTKQGHGLT